MTMRGTSTMTPTKGARVYTADGDELGKVKEVSGACFKVDAAMQPDYWLASDCLTGSTGEGLRLNFTKDQLGDMKLDGPNDTRRTHTGIHRHDETVL